MKECCVCFDGYKKGVRCFGSCKIDICLKCFNNILTLNVVDQVEYVCPQCRITSIKNEDKTFTKFLNNNKKCLKRVIHLLEENTEDKSKRMVENSWVAFNTRVNGQDILRFLPQYLAEIT